MRTVGSFRKTKHKLANCRGGGVRGQSMVELALTLPLLLLVLFGTVDLGRLFMSNVSITNASRQGARYGMANSTDPSQTKIKQAAVDEAGGLITAANVLVECSADGVSYSSANCGSVQPGGRIRVTVNYTFQFVTLSIVGLSSISLSENTIMVIVN